MKKRPIIFGLLLVASIIFMVIHSCNAKAEGVIEVTPNPTFELPDWSFEPITPSPEPTPAPTPSPEGVEQVPTPSEEWRGVDPNLQSTYIYTRQYKTAWRPANIVNASGYTYYLFNGGGSAVLVGTDIVNFSSPSRGGVLSVGYDDDGEEFPLTDFSHETQLFYTTITPLSIDFQYQSFVYAFTDVPQVDLKGDFKITYNLTVPMYTKVTIPLGAEGVYSSIGLNDSTIKYGTVHTLITVYGSEGTVIPFQFNHTISQFTKGIKDTIEVTELSDTEVISSVGIMYVMLPFGYNEFYNALEAAFESYGQTPSQGSLYGSWMLSSSALSFQRTVKYTDTRTLIEKILNGIKSVFIPSPDALQEVILSLIPMEYDGSVGFVFQFRNTLMGFFDYNDDAVITLPKFVFKMNYATSERGLMVWDDYRLNLTQTIANSETLRTIQRYVKYINGFIITFAFFNSLFAMVCSVFGLHWYKGVESDDIAEVD